MRVAIVGYRNFNDYYLFKKAVIKVLEEWGITHIEEAIEKEIIECIVSGGADGIDTLAEKFADEYKISKKIFLPDYSIKYLPRKAIPLLRNMQIINYSTHVIAFPSRYGSGTQDSISKAEQENKIMKILWVD